MSILALSLVASNNYSLKFNKRKKELIAIHKKNITLFNRFVSIFGCGPLAHLDGSLKTINSHLITKKNEVNLWKKNKQAYATVTKIANQVFSADSKNDKLFKMVSKAKKMNVNVTIDITVSVGKGQLQQIKEDSLDLGRVTYYKNSTMPTGCMHKQILKFEEILKERLKQKYPELPQIFRHNSVYLWNENSRIQSYNFTDLSKKEALILPLNVLLHGFYALPSQVGIFTLKFA